MEVIVKGQPSIEIGFETKVIQVGGLGDIDSSLSTESENPVQNKVITEELGKKATKTELSALETKVTETDEKLTELSAEINGESMQKITTQAGVGFNPNKQRFPINIGSGKFKVRLVDYTGVLSITSIGLWIYDKDGNELLSGVNVPKYFVEKTITSDAVSFAIYASAAQVVENGELYLEFEGDTINYGLKNNVAKNNQQIQQIDNTQDLLENEILSLYYEPGGILFEETENDSLSRSFYIPVQVGDKVSAFIYRIKKFDAERNYIGEELTDSNGENLLTYEVLDENCKYIRLLCYRGKEVAIKINGNSIIPEILEKTLFQQKTSGSGALSVTSEGVVFQSREGVIEIPTASESSLGFMSSADKRKLDGIINLGNITIEGSGITKNAAAYGFLPTNDGDTNAINLQKCVEGGGTILIDVAGIYELSRSIMLDSHTYLYFGANTIVSLTTSSTGKVVAYPFINRGALYKERNENIKIEGLRLRTNGLQNGTDIQIAGQRGYIAMKGIKNLSLKDIEILDVPNGWYTIHIQQFENINLEFIHIEGMKDGIHLGVGKKYRIAHCLFSTNDDSIALNAHDYPSGTSEFGWIENGIIEDVQILPTPTGNESRGVYCLGGAWTDWVKGNTYQPLGDACVSNGRIYVTCGTRGDTKITSTQQPNHLTDIMTYSDGLTWRCMDNTKPIYNAGVRDLIIKDVKISSGNRSLTFNIDHDTFSNGLYEGCSSPSFDNITVQNLTQDDFTSTYVFYSLVPFKNLKFINCQFKNGFRGITLDKIEGDTSEEASSMLTMGLSMYMNNNMFIKNDVGNRALNLKMVGTMIEHNTAGTPIVYNANKIDVISDIELNKVTL